MALECSRLVFSRHALHRMNARAISEIDVRVVVAGGEVIADYADDKPYPSVLLLGFVGDRKLHVVIARESSTGQCVVVTAYEAKPEKWETGFRLRRLK